MIFHIPFPFPVIFPINFFGSQEVVSIFDFILMGTLGISTLYGFFRGFLSELFSLLAWIVAVWAAVSFDDNLAVVFGSVIASETFKLWLARAVILAITLSLGAIATKKAIKAIGWSFSGNMLFGIGFGFLRGLVFIAMTILFLEDTDFYTEPMIQEAVFLEQAEEIADFFYNFFLEYYNQ